MTTGFNRRRVGCDRLARLLLLSGSSIGAAAPVFASPEGERVVAGSADFTRNGGYTRIVASNGAIINYNAFNIRPGETVQFVQPDASSRVLNRVLGPDPTVIDGTLLANGRVYFANQAGVYFRGGAVVNVGELYAAAGNISNADFQRGVNRFTDLTGTVRNDGLIQAATTVLTGASVINAGTINAANGTVVLVAGNDVLVGERDGVLYARISNAAPGASNTNATGLQTQSAAGLADAGPAGDQPGVTNSGTINARGGRVIAATGDMFGMAIRHSGHIAASNVELRGGAETATIVSGTIDASNPNGAGGTVKVLGKHVAVTGGSIDASGTTAGGTIHVGGNWQGRGTDPNAQTAYVDANASLKATTNFGQGGEIVVWSDGLTAFYGSADVSAQSGAGGRIETSGKEALDISGARIMARGLSGGTWLLDPTDLTIDNNATNNATFSNITGLLTLNAAASASVNAADIRTALANGVNVELFTQNAGQAGTGNITLDAAANLDVAMGANTATLTLRAANDIVINGTINATSTTGRLNIVMLANDGRGAGGGGASDDPDVNAGSVLINNAINTAGGAFTASGIGFTSINAGTIGTAGGAATLTFSTLTIGGNVTLAGGGLSLGFSGAGGAAINAVISNTAGLGNAMTFTRSAGVGLLQFNAGGQVLGDLSNVTFNAPIDVNANATIATTTGVLTFNNTIDGAAALTLSGTGATFFNAGVGQAGGLNALANNRTGLTTITADQRVTNNLNHAGDVAFAATPTVTLESTSSGSITLGGNVIGAGTALRLNTAGATTLSGVSITLTSLETDFGAFADAGTFAMSAPGVSLTTTGAVILNDVAGVTLRGTVNTGGNAFTIVAAAPLTLSGNLTIDAGAGLVTFGGTIAGGGNQLVLSAGAGDTIFNGAASGLTRLENLRTGTTTIAADQTVTNGLVRHAGAVILAGNVVIDSGSGDVTFDSTINADNQANNRLLQVTSSGTTTFTGAVGQGLNGRLLSLTTDAPGAVVSNGISTLAAILLQGSTNTLGGLYDTDGGPFTATGSMILSAATTIDTSAAAPPGGLVTLTGTIDGTTAGAQLLSIITGGGAVSASGIIGGTTALQSLSVDTAGANASFVGVNTAGAQTYTMGPPSAILTLSGTFATAGGAFSVLSGDVLLAANTTINAGSGNVSFNGAINSAAASTFALDVQSTGDVLFAGDIGATDRLSSLTVASAGNRANLIRFGNATPAATARVVRTTGEQSYFAVLNANDAAVTSGVRLEANLTFDSSTNGNITFDSTINAEDSTLLRTLAINTGGVTDVLGNIGFGTNGALETVSTDAQGGADITRLFSVITRSSQTYADNRVELRGVDTASATGATYDTTGNSAVASGGAFTVNSGATDNCILFANTVINVGTNSGPGTGTVIFNGLVDADQAANLRSLAIFADQGLVTFGADVGSRGAANDGTNGSLASLLIGQAGSNVTTINLQNVRTRGDQTYSGTTINLNGSAYTGNDSDGGGNLTFGDPTAAGPVSIFLNSAAGDRRVTITTGTSSNASQANIIFNGLVDTNAGAADLNRLTTNADGITRFAQSVGSVRRLAQIQALGFDATNAPNASVELGIAGQTAGPIVINTSRLIDGDGQIYSNAVTLGADVTISDDNTGVVTFNRTINADAAANNRALTINTAGITTFLGSIGATQELLSILIDDPAATLAERGGQIVFGGGGSTPAALSVRTSGAQTYNDNNQFFAGNAGVRILADVTFASSNTGNITFNTTIDSDGNTPADPRSIQVNTAGVTTFAQNIGEGAGNGANRLRSVRTDAPGSTVIGTAGADQVFVRTQRVSGAGPFQPAQQFLDNVTINAQAVFSDNNSGDITFGGTLNSDAGNNRRLAVNTTGLTTFVGAVGGTDALLAITTDAAAGDGARAALTGESGDIAGNITRFENNVTLVGVNIDGGAFINQAGPTAVTYNRLVALTINDLAQAGNAAGTANVTINGGSGTMAFRRGIQNATGATTGTNRLTLQTNAQSLALGNAAGTTANSFNALTAPNQLLYVQGYLAPITIGADRLTSNGDGTGIGTAAARFAQVQINPLGVAGRNSATDGTQVSALSTVLFADLSTIFANRLRDSAFNQLTALNVGPLQTAAQAVDFGVFTTGTDANTGITFGQNEKVLAFGNLNLASGTGAARGTITISDINVVGATGGSAGNLTVGETGTTTNAIRINQRAASSVVRFVGNTLTVVNDAGVDFVASNAITFAAVPVRSGAITAFSAGLAPQFASLAGNVTFGSSAFSPYIVRIYPRTIYTGLANPGDTLTLGSSANEFNDNSDNLPVGEVNNLLAFDLRAEGPTQSLGFYDSENTILESVREVPFGSTVRQNSRDTWFAWDRGTFQLNEEEIVRKLRAKASASLPAEASIPAPAAGSTR